MSVILADVISVAASTLPTTTSMPVGQAIKSFKRTAQVQPVLATPTAGSGSNKILIVWQKSDISEASKTALSKIFGGIHIYDTKLDSQLTAQSFLLSSYSVCK